MMAPVLFPSSSGEDLDSPPQPAAETLPALLTTKRLIWLYFWLLLFEGALRKWILPGLSNPLLLIRDPIVILIYVSAATAGAFPRNPFIVWIVGLGLLSIVVSELFGTGNLLVTLYGFRTSFLHLPLIFLIPNVFNKEDLEKMGKWLLITSLPMALLVLAQFRAAPDAWINNGAGGGVGGQLEVGFGKIRPPGTFSFTAGLVTYVSMVAAVALHTQMQKNAPQLKLATASLGAVAVMVGVSGSRAALGAVTLIVVAVAVICLQKPAFFGRGIKLVVIGGAAYFALGFWSEFQQGIEIHQSRIEGGGGLKDGIIFRVLAGLIEPFYAVADAPFFGVGLGMGTNGASGLLYGKQVFDLGEGDWERIVRESGPILGFIYIGFRIAIVVELGRRAWAALKRDQPLPLLLFACAFPGVLVGQWGVPMLLGLAVFSAGLCLAASNAELPIAAINPASNEAELAATARGVRGRSVYADQLHGEIEDPDTARFGP